MTNKKNFPKVYFSYPHRTVYIGVTLHTRTIQKDAAGQVYILVLYNMCFQMNKSKSTAFSTEIKGQF